MKEIIYNNYYWQNDIVRLRAWATEDWEWDYYNNFDSEAMRLADCEVQLPPTIVDWPNVFDIAVKPSFQNKGLAKNMIKKALNVLEQQYPVLRLFVTVGNDAEIAYDKIGFLAGTETTEMILSIV